MRDEDIATGASPSESTSLPSELIHASRRGELKKIIKWLRKGNDLDARCPDGRSLLHAAVMSAQHELVQELLRRGAKVDLPNYLGSSALFAAAEFGNQTALEMLLGNRA